MPAMQALDRRIVALPCVLLLHLALLWLLRGASIPPAPRGAPAAAEQRLLLRMIPARVARAPIPQTTAEGPVRAYVPKPARLQARAAAAVRRTAISPSEHDEAGVPAPAVPARTPASASAGTPSLLDTEATRRAIRASARTPSLTEQLARAREEPHRAGTQERLGEAVKSSGKGDCLKGEYAGAGMGLLSLPFLAAASLRGDCAQ